ncbi:MAG TPA: potassium-transporting ATPase subunit KdpA [Candidatus Acidoferrales bacterium]|jgi:K+-transporting ATPase ATPase A chain|nr:potassium-transporting ATPase subunit KdpA [Candidatus Acidoferrales bacterium]
MTNNGWFQILFFLLVVLALTKPLGAFMTRVFNREKTFLDPVLRPIEKLVYRLTGVDETKEMRWTEYAGAMLLFSGVTMVALYLLERIQNHLPLNPQNLGPVAPDLAFNTAASFTTNTNWQAYVPEVTMSYLTQMAGLAYHNFVSAAVGIALAIAIVRGIARREQDTIGNFWVDMTRATFWVLLPICLLGSLLLVWQGVPQTFKPYSTAQLVDPQTVQTTDASGKTTTQVVKEQTIALGPTASQEMIKNLGTNGGGFFNTNSAHPFENPTPLTNLFEMLLIFAIGAGLTYTLGQMTGSPRHGWAVWCAMAILFLVGMTAAYSAEARGNPLVQNSASHVQPSGNMEGKEVRFGIANSALWAVVTTDTSCGAVNSMHDSYTPLGGMIPLINMLLGEVVFGGVGAGLYGTIVFIILSVFIAGLMVGRTPEYLGKKIEAFDVKMAMLTVLIHPLLVLSFTAISVVAPKFGLSALTNTGPHGLTEIFYAYEEAAANNGSAFAGLNANTLWYNTTLATTMLFGRFFMVLPVLAIAGSLVKKKHVPETSGTFPVTTPLFAGLLISVILIVGALTFFPALSLGPILEHLLMNAGKTF